MRRLGIVLGAVATVGLVACQPTPPTGGPGGWEPVGLPPVCSVYPSLPECESLRPTPLGGGTLPTWVPPGGLPPVCDEYQSLPECEGASDPGPAPVTAPPSAAAARVAGGGVLPRTG